MIKTWFNYWITTNSCNWITGIFKPKTRYTISLRYTLVRGCIIFAYCFFFLASSTILEGCTTNIISSTFCVIQTISCYICTLYIYSCYGKASSCIPYTFSRCTRCLWDCAWRLSNIASTCCFLFLTSWSIGVCSTISIVRWTFNIV